MKRWVISSFGVAGLACASSSSADAESSGSDTATTTDAGSSTGSAADCEEDDFAAAGEFAGPGWSPTEGLLGPAQATYWAHSTWIKLKPTAEAQAKFNEYLGPAAAEAFTTEGMIGAQLGGSAQCGTGRTLGVWRSREDMIRYVGSAAHLAAVAAMGTFAEDAATTSWEIEAAQLPLTFEVAIARLGIP